MKISLLTTFFNRPDHIRLLLASLARQQRLPDEVIVADDGSDPACAAALQTYTAQAPFPTRIIRQDHQGFRAAAARNLAIRAATGDYLLFIDGDIMLLPESLARHEQIAGAGQVLCGNRALLDATSTQALFASSAPLDNQMLEQAWQQADPAEARKAETLFAHHARLRRWHLARPHKPKILGCHFSLFRQDAERINGFDENYVGWGYEDDDFAMRLYKTGVRPVSVIASVRALHLWHPSLAPDTGQRHRDRPNRAYFRRRFVRARCKAGLQSL